MNVVYITVGERCTNGIIRTQVEQLLEALSSEHIITWIACVPAHRACECRVASDAGEGSQVRRVVIPVPVRNLWMSPAQARSLATVCSRIARAVIRDRVDVIHARGYAGAEFARVCAASFNAPWVFDPRGLYPQEMLRVGPARLRYSQPQWSQREAEYWVDSSAAISVSESMAAYFMHAHGHRTGVHTIPCHGGDASVHLPEVTDSPSRAVYLGSLGTWASAADIAKLYQRVARGFDAPLGLTVVTQEDSASVLRALVTAGVEDTLAEVVRADRDEVPRILSRSAIGLLSLDNSLAKRVSWPVKLSEYLMNGLQVAAWSSDCTWATYAESVGALVSVGRDANSPMPTWRLADSNGRAAIRAKASERVSLQANVDSLNCVWKEIAGCSE